MPAAIVWAVSAIGASIGSAAMIMYAAEIASAVMLVGGLAYSAAAQKKAKQKAKDAYNAAQVDRMVNISSAIAPRELVLGRVRKGGMVVFKGSTDAFNRSLYLVIALAAHEIDAVEQIYLNDQPVTLNGGGEVLEAPYWNAEYNASYMYIGIHLGQPGQTADAHMMAAFPGAWPATNTLDGIAYLVVQGFFSETAFPSGMPNVTALVRGAKLYDTRTGITAWSENPALMARHVYQHPKFGKATITAAEEARFITAANACDTSTVYTVGGVAQPATALYKAALVLPFGTAAKSGLDDLAQAMAGSWAFAGGELYIKAGVYTAPVMTLGDADLAVIQRNGATETQRPISISVHKERAQQFNTIKATIWDAGQDYKQATLSPLVGAALLARDGVELVQEVTMPAVGYAPQALHIAGVMLRDARDPLTVALPFKLRAYPLEIFDTVTLTLSRYGWAGKTFQILARSWTADGTLQLTLKETTAAITQMDAGFSAQGFAANTNLPKPWEVADMGALTIASGTDQLFLQADGTVQSRMRISWPQIVDAAVLQAGRIEVQYRRDDYAGEWTVLVAPGDDTSIITPDVQDLATYTVRARAKTQTGIGAWTAVYTHQVIGKTAPPPVFDFFMIVAQPDGTRQYNFGYTGVAPADWRGADIRYVNGTTATPDWDTMTPLQDTTTFYTSSPVELNAPLAGTYTFAIKSLDTSGNASAYLVRNITLPARRLGNVFDEFHEHTDGWPGTRTGCQVQDGFIQATDATTWATLPATWYAWTRWNMAPASPITYTSPARDFGTIISGSINSSVDADGTMVQELATSADGATWSAWGSAAAPFISRYIKLRLTVTATAPAPVPVIRSWGYMVLAPMKNEYLNDIVISGLTGAYRIGTGDIRIPLAGSYTTIKRTSIVIQDSSAGTWTYARIDQSLSPSPRWQFRLNGTLADPAFVDFFIEGY